MRDEMDVPIAAKCDIAEREFVTESDWIPGFWNYLLDLDRDDLVAELIQNDLDQDATRSVITFERDRLVSEGNGRSVDANGWMRLRKIQGAGGDVPAKRGKIGVKNHGLKTAFTIGDEILLVSDGQAIVQTLYANGRDKPPHPGASATPVHHPQAPETGCRIIIHYRTAAVEPPQGEASVLPAVSADEMDALFRSSCASVPEQFAGIVSPKVVPRYEIILRHRRLGEARFTFSCTRPRRIARRIELFRRRCAINGSASDLPEGLQEMAARRLIPLKGRLRQRIADFYRHKNRFFVEVSWPVDGHGKPQAGIGRFRYPIGYPADSHEARTGHSTYFNAPIASDNKRHSPARNEGTNGDLRRACEDLLIDVLARHTVPRWGADGLNPLIPSPGADNQDQAVRPLLAALAAQGAMPVLNWTAAVKRWDSKSHRRKSTTRRTKIPPAAARARRRYRFIVPAPTWERGAVDPALSIVSPWSELQLDPRTPGEIVELVADGSTDGFGEVFVTFDEDDAFSRLAEGNDYFGSLSEPETDLAHLFIARAYLNVIHSALEQRCCDEDTETALQGALLLPDSSGQPVPFHALHSCTLLPPDVPGLMFPPILHPDLATHKLFKRRKWRRPPYTMTSFLKSGALENADEGTRKLFWTWLRRNQRQIRQRDRPKLANLAVWPDDQGRFCTLEELCGPRSRRVAIVLGDFIRRPHEQVRQSKLLSAGSRARTAIRRVPTDQEVVDWLNDRLALFPFGAIADARTVSALDKFEADVAVLLRETKIARALKAAAPALPALAQDDSIRERRGLAVPNRAVERLALPTRFLLKHKQRAASLDKLSPVLNTPTAGMVIDAFSEDGTHFRVLQARLRHLMSCTEPDDAERRQLAELPIIPVDEKPARPSSLAFRGTKGDYWGAWKARISSNGLSQDDQRRYLAAGVTSALPNRETSRAFFEWLSEQNETVLGRHVSCVLRHILHRDGPAHWGDIFTDIPFIPARGRDGLCLVSLRTAKHRPVFLPDVGDIADAIVQRDSRTLLVIDSVEEVNEPITHPLRNIGIRSLRETLGEPESVFGAGETKPAKSDVLEGLQALCSTHFRHTFRKRLDKLEVEPDLVRHDWHDRLSCITSVRVADTVEARYRFRRSLYVVQTDAGFDPDSGTFWIKSNRDDGLSSLYEAIAAQLVFKPSARPLDCLALERALGLEIRDRSYGRPSDASSNLEDVARDEEVAGADAQTASGNRRTDGAVDTGEAVFGHSPFEPDPSRNIPSPDTISSSTSAKFRKTRNRSGGGSGSEGRSTAGPAPALEQEHVDDIKRKHYASHCQICLCERSPRELAPAGSYVQWEEVRRGIMEAHHVDLKSAGGARHAGNLILLCKHHHNTYGRRLSRAVVTKALQGDAVDKVIRFEIEGVGITEVKGRQIKLVIPDTGEIVKIFFTVQHADYWLSQAGPSHEASGGPLSGGGTYVLRTLDSDMLGYVTSPGETSGHEMEDKQE